VVGLRRAALDQALGAARGLGGVGLLLGLEGALLLRRGGRRRRRRRRRRRGRARGAVGGRGGRRLPALALAACHQASGSTRGGVHRALCERGDW
jgi:hypothetical protein